MNKRMTLAPASLLLTVSLLPAMSPRAEKCPEGEHFGADLGIGVVLCVGGECSRFEDANGDLVYDLSSEPRLLGIRPGGPSDGKLVDGDVLVSIDGYVATSVDGGKRLGSPPDGRSVQLLVRRSGHLETVSVAPVRHCHRNRLVVASRQEIADGTWMNEPEEPPTRPPAPAGSIGVTLACRDCGWHDIGAGRIAWLTGSLPVVAAVAPRGPAERGGLRPGDVITHVDGMGIETEEGGVRFAEAAAGETLEIRFLRDGSPRTTQLVVAPPEPTGVTF